MFNVIQLLNSIQILSLLVTQNYIIYMIANFTFIDYIIDNNNIHIFEKQALKNLRWKYVECNSIKEIENFF